MVSSKAKNKATAFSVVNLKLNTVLNDAFLPKAAVLPAVKNMNKITLDVYHLANLHHIRCFMDGFPAPKHSSGFYNCCCTLVKRQSMNADCVNDIDNDNDAGEDGDIDYPAEQPVAFQLERTHAIYNSLRPNDGSYDQPFEHSMSCFVNDAPMQMLVAAKNHIIEVFEGRLKMYLAAVMKVPKRCCNM